jgi:hypothetical protein
VKAIVIASCAAFIALGCQKSEPPAPLVASAAPAASVAPVATVDPALPAADSAAAAAPAAAEPAAVAAAVKAVPAEADYEVQAQTTITPANAAQVLSAIDKQVGN